MTTTTNSQLCMVDRVKLLAYVDANFVAVGSWFKSSRPDAGQRHFREVREVPFSPPYPTRTPTRRRLWVSAGVHFGPTG
ncbi:MAG: hypothetical protein QOC63_5592 [Mycobacterium sp.]|nr:hypothetical protein [Mycobacterium sp.]